MGNPTLNVILKIINLVLGILVWMYNIKYIYIYEDDLWSGILEALAFATHYTASRLKFYTTGQLLFGRDIIPLIKQMVGWELIIQKNQAQINK